MAPPVKIVAMIGLVAVGAAVGPSAAEASPLGSTVDRLAATQDRSGGFSSGRPGAAPNHAYSAWAALAVAAAGEAPTAWRRAGGDLASAAERLPRSPGLVDTLRATVALRAAGRNPRRRLGGDPLAAIAGAQAADGSVGGVAMTAWAIFALRALGRRPGGARIETAARAIRRARRRDGGWASVPGRRTDVITTATAVQALVASGARAGADPDLAAARAYLARAQRRDGGFGLRRGRRSVASSSAWAALAIAALGERDDRGRWGRAGGPRRWLARALGPGGRLAPRAVASGEPPTLVHAVTALALARRPLPLVARGPRRSISHAPRITGRVPAATGRVGPALIVRYRDEAGGSGVAPRRVRILVNGRDLTPIARVTPFSLQLRGAALPPGRLRVRVRVADRAGNVLWRSWVVRGPARGR